MHHLYTYGIDQIPNFRYINNSILLEEQALHNYVNMLHSEES